MSGKEPPVVNSHEKVEIPPDAFLRTTRQLWKLLLGGIVLPLPTALLAWWSIRQIRPEQPASEIAMALGLLATGALAIVAVLASVKCPRCQLRLLARVLRAPEGLTSMTSLLKARTCPECGFDPTGGSRAG